MSTQGDTRRISKLRPGAFALGLFMMAAMGIAFQLWLGNPSVTVDERVSMVWGWIGGWLFRSYLAD